VTLVVARKLNGLTLRGLSQEWLIFKNYMQAYKGADKALARDTTLLDANEVRWSHFESK